MSISLLLSLLVSPRVSCLKGGKPGSVAPLGGTGCWKSPLAFSSPGRHGQLVTPKLQPKSAAAVLHCLKCRCNPRVKDGKFGSDFIWCLFIPPLMENWWNEVIVLFLCKENCCLSDKKQLLEIWMTLLRRAFMYAQECFSCSCRKKKPKNNPYFLYRWVWDD